MDNTPKTHILESLHSQRGFGWKEWAAEIFDNAFDADAMTVTVEIEKNLIRVSDDGRGCADLSAMFSVGDHKAHPGKPGIGKFGIGFKDAALMLEGRVTIRSMRFTLCWKGVLLTRERRAPGKGQSGDGSGNGTHCDGGPREQRADYANFHANFHAKLCQPTHQRHDESVYISITYLFSYAQLRLVFRLLTEGL
jgi:hypothetical protein